ncbi:MAG: hypothetical protein ACOYOU_20335, partial [Kiritimatiellia bacterium]
MKSSQRSSPHSPRSMRQRLLSASWLLPFWVVGVAFSLQAQATNEPALLPEKPRWLTDASLTVRESYDNNI